MNPVKHLWWLKAFIFCKNSFIDVRQDSKYSSGMQHFWIYLVIANCYWWNSSQTIRLYYGCWMCLDKPSTAIIVCSFAPDNATLYLMLWCWSSMQHIKVFILLTAQKVSIFGVILVCIQSDQNNFEGPE